MLLNKILRVGELSSEYVLASQRMPILQSYVHYELGISDSEKCPPHQSMLVMAFVERWKMLVHEHETGYQMISWSSGIPLPKIVS